MKLAVFIAIAVIGISMEFDNPSVADSGDSTRFREVIAQIKPVLKKYRQPARIDFHSLKCVSGDNGDWDFSGVTFPQTNVAPPTSDENILAAVRSVFRGDPSVTVTQDKSGLIRIRVGAFSDALINTKIRKISFTPEDQYNLVFAIDRVESAPVVAKAMVRLRRHPNIVPFFGAVMDPTEGWPHLPAAMVNTSYGEVLDAVAITFGGIVSHGECDKPGRIDTTFDSVFDVLPPSTGR